MTKIQIHVKFAYQHACKISGTVGDMTDSWCIAYLHVSECIFFEMLMSTICTVFCLPLWNSLVPALDCFKNIFLTLAIILSAALPIFDIVTDHSCTVASVCPWTAGSGVIFVSVACMHMCTCSINMTVAC